MYYYEVWVRSNRYHGHSPLTYSSAQKLSRGRLVTVELQTETVLGFISNSVTPPRFKTKPIVSALDLPPLPPHSLKLAAWLQAYYPAPIGVLTQHFLPSNLTQKSADKFTTTSYAPANLANLPPLTGEQASALAAIADQNTYLLHGITGSGKTRLYIEKAAQTIARGNSVIVLTPEISLTSQLAANFKAVFGERVVVMHSKQAPAERRQAWLTSLWSEEPLIIIGPRSALFSPLLKLGLIVIDEAHEAAYKQQQAPQYQAGRVASYSASLTRATLILGSATPSVSDYYLATAKQKPIIVLNQTARKNNNTSRKITVVDRKDQLLFERSSFFSRPLIEAVKTALKNNEQSLLYLNRRGTARLVLCEKCGWLAACPHCDLPLTYHGDRHEMRCHSCQHRSPAPSSCPECKHTGIIFKTAGTKAIATEAKHLFPQARIARFDTDNLKTERFEEHYEAVKSGDFDILVGTQLLAKGLDLPRLSTLGVLLADTSLYLPDFSAQERTYQLLTQVLGRVGRGHVSGQAIIQTYHPDHAILKAAIDGDYQTFYEAEMASRRQFMFPPFCYLLKLTVRRTSVKSAESAATKLKAAIEASGQRVRVEGPAPSFYERLQGKYQWQLVVKAQDRSVLLSVINNLPAGWSYDLDPMDLL